MQNKNEQAEALAEVSRIIKQLCDAPNHLAVTDSKGNVLEGLEVWSTASPYVKECPWIVFDLCEIWKGSTKNKLKLRSKELKYSNVTFEASYNLCWNVNTNLDPLSIKDLSDLQHTNIPCIANVLEKRYMQDTIYTWADPLLVAANPYRDLNNVTSELAETYRRAPDINRMPPHVFAVSKIALQCNYDLQTPQCIIVSGESGAGKTETTKHIMKYLSLCSSKSTSEIQEAVLAANPILEAFGNAKTIRNDNSSRFGRFMQLKVSPQYGIEHGRIVSFLLEKSRIVHQAQNERSYHIFYYLIKGASSALKKKLNVLSVDEYTFLTSKCDTVPDVDDQKEFTRIYNSFKINGLTDQEIESLFSILSGILLIGNVKIIEQYRNNIEDAAAICPTTRSVFQKACALLEVEESIIEDLLINKTSFAAEEEVVTPWKAPESIVLLQSVAKATYESLFVWIIYRINSAIYKTALTENFIALLDIFGFEVLNDNSLEQMLINLTNERLQKNFIDVVFAKENEIYKSQGIIQIDMQWTDNNEIVSVLSNPKESLIACLSDQCLAPQGSDKAFVTNAKQVFSNNQIFSLAKVSPDLNFVVHHSIGKISYSADGFLKKNMDVLRHDMVKAFKNSKNDVIRAIFKDVVIEPGKLPKNRLVSVQYSSQLEHLIELINKTETHFIRCVKPNEVKKPKTWSIARVLVQLHALSVFEALQLKDLGYSYRRPFDEFLLQFKYLDLALYSNTTLSDEQKVRKLLSRVDLPDGSWQVGRTYIFLKTIGPKMLAIAQREKMSRILPIIQTMETTYCFRKLREQMARHTPAVIRLQSHIRRLKAVNEF